MHHRECSPDSEIVCHDSLSEHDLLDLPEGFALLQESADDHSVGHSADGHSADGHSADEHPDNSMNIQKPPGITNSNAEASGTYPATIQKSDNNWPFGSPPPPQQLTHTRDGSTPP